MSSKTVSKHVLICGLDGAGKTTLFNLLVNGQPTDPKIRPDGTLGLTNKKMASETETLGFNFDYSDPHQAASCIGFWDLGGKDSIRSIWSSFYMNIRVSGVIFVVDANDDEDRITDARMELQKLLNEEELRTAVLYVVFNDTNNEDEEKRGADENPIRKSVRIFSFFFFLFYLEPFLRNFLSFFTENILFNGRSSIFKKGIYDNSFNNQYIIFWGNRNVISFSFFILKWAFYMNEDFRGKSWYECNTSQCYKTIRFDKFKEDQRQLGDAREN